MTPATPTPYRRLILQLGQNGSQRAAMRVAADFARRLRLDLHCRFVEDEAVLQLAEFSFVREIRLPTHQWSVLTADRIAEELRHATEQARRLMAEIATATGIPTQFEVVRGDPARCLTGLCSASDIVVLVQPVAPLASSSFQFLQLHQAALDAAASVLLLPEQMSRQAGTVVAILAAPHDPALPVAARIAAETDEALLILLPAAIQAEQQVVRDAAVAIGVPPARVTTGALPGDSPEDVLQALAPMQERLIVVTRTTSSVAANDGARRIAVARGVPMLLVEPPGADTH